MKILINIKSISTLLLVFTFIINCSEKPAAPNYNNIYDPASNFDDIPPVAHLIAIPDSGIANETEFIFDASQSKEIEMPDAKLYFRWDLNNDGIWDTIESQNPRINYIYGIGGGEKIVKVLVKGGGNLTSVTTISVFVNSRPMAKLNWIEDYNIENLIHLDASNSWDYEDEDNLQYRWDFNNDGSWDISWNDNPYEDYNFSSSEWSLKLEVRDSNKLASQKSIIGNFPDDPVAYYPFTGNAMDESGHQNHGIVENVTLVKDRFDNNNSAYEFNGTNSLIRIPHSEILNLDAYSKSFSISLWLKSDNPKGKRLFEKWNEHIDTPYPVSFQVNSEACNAGIYDDRSNSIRPIVKYGNIWDDQWHHIIFIVDVSTNIVIAYLDGEISDSVINTTKSSTANTVDIIVGGDPKNDNYYEGIIDDIRIYGRALTDNEVFLLFME